MPSKGISLEQYINELPEDRKEPFQKIRQQILNNLPKQLEETISYGMLGYVVPHAVYPNGYHCNPKLPLPFMNLASQKKFIAVYSMVLYSKKELMDWFILEYKKRCKYKLDMGKSCIRFKKMNDIPYDLITQLAQKMSPSDWIDLYEANVVK